MSGRVGIARMAAAKSYTLNLKAGLVVWFFVLLAAGSSSFALQTARNIGSSHESPARHMILENVDLQDISGSTYCKSARACSSTASSLHVLHNCKRRSGGWGLERSDVPRLSYKYSSLGLTPYPGVGRCFQGSVQD